MCTKTVPPSPGLQKYLHLQPLSYPVFFSVITVLSKFPPHTGGVLVGRGTRDREVAGSTPG